MTHPGIRPNGWRLGTGSIIAILGVSVPSTGFWWVKRVSWSYWWWWTIQWCRTHSNQTIPLRWVRLGRRWRASIGSVATSVVVVRVGERWVRVRGLIWSLRSTKARIRILVRGSWLSRWRGIAHVISRNIRRWLLVRIPWETHSKFRLSSIFPNYFYIYLLKKQKKSIIHTCWILWRLIRRTWRW